MPRPSGEPGATQSDQPAPPKLKARRHGRPPSTDAKERKPVRSVEKAFEILEFLALHETRMSFADIATTLDIPPATAHRILTTLVERGYLNFDDASTFGVGSRFIRLARGTLRVSRVLRDLARSYLRDLVESTGETANLAILDGTEAAHLDQVQTYKMLRAQTFLRVPLHCSGTGKVLLAYTDAASQAELVRQLDLDRLTEHTISAADDLKPHLVEVRKQGFAIDDEETEIGVRCIAAPILVGAQAIASISISGPTTRITGARLDDLIAEVRGVAAALSEAASDHFPELGAGDLH